MGDDCCGIGSGVEVLAELLVPFGFLVDHVGVCWERSLPSRMAPGRHATGSSE